MDEAKVWEDIWKDLDKVTALQKVLDVKFIEIVKCSDTNKAVELTKELMKLI